MLCLLTCMKNMVQTWNKSNTLHLFTYLGLIKATIHKLLAKYMLWHLLLTPPPLPTCHHFLVLMKFGFCSDPLPPFWSMSLSIPFFYLEGFPNSLFSRFHSNCSDCTTCSNRDMRIQIWQRCHLDIWQLFLQLIKLSKAVCFRLACN